MIEYKIKDPDFFLRAMKSIATVVDETVIQFGKGIRTYGLDPSRIVLYELVIGKSQMDIIHDGKISIMISLTDLQKVLLRLTRATELTIKYDGSNKLTMIGKVDAKKKTFNLNTLDSEIPEDHMESLKEMPLNTIFEMNLAELLDMMEDSEIYSEYFNLIARDGKVMVIASGVNGSMVSEYTLEDSFEEGSSGYSLQYAKSILKALGSADVLIAFSEDMPIMFFNKISADSFVRWYLAPRVDHDDYDDYEDDD